MNWISAKDELPDATQYPHATPLLVIARDPKDEEDENLYFYRLAFRHGDRFTCHDDNGESFVPDIKFWLPVPEVEDLSDLKSVDLSGSEPKWVKKINSQKSMTLGSGKVFSFNKGDEWHE